MQRRAGDRLLDRFRIDAVFTGGLGVLCAVTDLHSGRRYAVKTIKDEHKGKPAVVRRFLDEAATWIALGRHDFLVQAYWLVEDAPEPYLFLEFVEGQDLAALLAGGPLPLPRALDLAMQCAAGMAYAHTKALEGGVGVVHLDLKPTNLLIGAGDLLKVTDFGLARVVGAPRDAGGPREGTPAYMAPEQLQGDAPLDGRTDVYSFGLVLLEMLAGENPLLAETFAEQVRRALEMEPPPPADVPDELAALVGRCVAKDPERRPRDFMEVLAHLARTARGLEHAWHVDPKGVAAPRRPAGIVLEGPALRPRRPRSGEPFGAVLTVRGDVGRGPVDLLWRPAPGPGLELVGAARSRVEAGGRVHLTLRATLAARAEGPARLGESTLVVRGPEAEATYRVPECAVEVVYAFQAPLVGRDEVVARFRELLGRGRGALFVRGGLGLGKTRLLQEFARIAAAEGRRAVVGRAQAAGLRPMRLLNETARALLDLPAAEPGNVRAAVNALLGHEPAAARYFIGILTGDLALDPEAPPTHAWFALLRAASAREPLALLLDDLHHADESAVRILRELIERAAESELPVVFAGTLRGDAPDLPAVELAPLTRADVDRLLDGVFPGHGLAEDAPWLAPAIAAATAGNPFHAAEILHALRVGSDAPIRREQGEWRVSGALSPETLDDLVPAAVEDAVVARTRGLPKTARRVLELAALAGEEFDAAVVREALGDAAAAEAALGELEDRGLIRPVAGGPGLDRYRLWTAALAPALRRQLQARAPVRARKLHAAVARGMLAVYRDETRTRMALSIAQHLRAAGESARSLPLTLAGCRRLLGLQLPERARRVLHGSRAIAEEAGGELRHRFDYLYGLACEATGDYDAGSAALTRFVEAGVALPEEPRAVPRAYVRLGRIHKARGEYDRAQYSFGAALQLLDDMGDRRTSAFVLDSLAELALLRRRHDEAERLLAQAAARAEETGNEAAAIQTLVVRGGLDVARGRPGPARRAFEEAAKRAEWLGDRRRWAAALEGLGQAALESGYLDEARARLEKAVDLRAWMGDRPGVARGLLLLGTVHHAATRIDQALRNYRRALRVFLEVGQREGVAEAHLQAGRVLHARGKTTAAVKDLAAAAEQYAAIELPDRFRALHALGRALADAGSERPARLALARADRGAPSRIQRVFSRVVRARLALDQGQVERARRLAERSVRRAARTTGHVARILAHLALAEAALAGGDLETARRGAETALAFAREEGQQLQAARAERLLAELAALEGRLDDAAVHAHRAARAYTGRRDTGDGPARLLVGLARGLAGRAPERAARYRRAARRCYARLEAQGFRAPAEPALSHEGS